MKKKTFVILSILLFAFCLSACGRSNHSDSEQLNADIVGDWTLSAVKLNDITHVDTEHLSQYNYAFSFTEDGQASATALGIRYTTSYEIKDGWIVFADADLAAVKLEIVDDTLELDMNAIGGGLVFTKDAAATE